MAQAVESLPAVYGCHKESRTIKLELSIPVQLIVDSSIDWPSPTSKRESIRKGEWEMREMNKIACAIQTFT